MNTKEKNRDIPLADYLMNLQIEYLINDFRRKIYASPSDKRYHTKVMEYKKEKIDNIADRNKLPTIFTSHQVKKEVYSELFNEFNQPTFEMNEKDDKFYFDYGSDFMIHSKKKIGKIQTVDFAKNQAVLLLDNDLFTTELVDVSRIL